MGRGCCGVRPQLPLPPTFLVFISTPLSSILWGLDQLSRWGWAFEACFEGLCLRCGRVNGPGGFFRCSAPCLTFVFRLISKVGLAKHGV